MRTYHSIGNRIYNDKNQLVMWCTTENEAARIVSTMNSDDEEVMSDHQDEHLNFEEEHQW